MVAQKNDPKPEPALSSEEELRLARELEKAWRRAVSTAEVDERFSEGSAAKASFLRNEYLRLSTPEERVDAFGIATGRARTVDRAAPTSGDTLPFSRGRQMRVAWAYALGIFIIASSFSFLMTGAAKMVFPIACLSVALGVIGTLQAVIASRPFKA